jgi:hypothetical protein
MIRINELVAPTSAEPPTYSTIIETLYYDATISDLSTNQKTTKKFEETNYYAYARSAPIETAP